MVCPQPVPVNGGVKTGNEAVEPSVVADTVFTGRHVCPEFTGTGCAFKHSSFTGLVINVVGVNEVQLLS